MTGPVSLLKTLTVTLGVLVLVASAALSGQESLQPPRLGGPSTADWFWYDDLEPPDPGWSHGDFGETAVPHFHVDSYMAHSGSYSWWCGTFEYDANGGYGNNWRDVLEIPPVDWTGYT